MAGNNDEGKLKLIQGIKEDASKEAERIREQTENALNEKKEAITSMKKYRIDEI